MSFSQLWLISFIHLSVPVNTNLVNFYTFEGDLCNCCLFLIHLREVI